MSHTPGPWEWSESDVLRGPDYTDVAKAWATFDDDGISVRNDADKALIAAAPDLLEALQFYMAIFGNTAYSVTRESAQGAHEKGSAAIAKALGK